MFVVRVESVNSKVPVGHMAPQDGAPAQNASVQRNGVDAPLSARRSHAWLMGLQLSGDGRCGGLIVDVCGRVSTSQIHMCLAAKVESLYSVWR
jgi:hypothetical protein